LHHHGASRIGDRARCAGSEQGVAKSFTIHGTGICGGIAIGQALLH
jgi:hypothetical protein